MVDPCGDKRITAVAADYMACKVRSAMQHPYATLVDCERGKAPAQVEIKLDIDMWSDATLSEVTLRESNVESPWFARRLVEQLYRQEYPGLGGKPFRGSLTVAMTRSEVTTRIFPLGCERHHRQAKE